MTLGPAGKLLGLLDRHPMRPAHIHIIVSFNQWRVQSNYLTGPHFQAVADGYKPVTTQIFDRKSPYLEDDSVFAVKESLIVDFVPLKDNPKAALELEYNIVLKPF